MPKFLRKKPITLNEARDSLPAKGAYVETQSGTFIPQNNRAKTRRYARVVPDCDEPLMKQAYRSINEGRFVRPAAIKTLQRQNRDRSKCYKAAWLFTNRDFDEDRCLLFPGFVEGRRVRVKYNYRNMSAAEAMALMVHGAPAFDGAEVAHKCGNGHLSCVNPKHLYWATKEENARDRVLHNTASAKRVDVSPEAMAAILDDRRLRAVIAWEYGVPVAQVAEIQSGR